MERGSDPTPAALPIGRSGRLEAVALTAADDHALLVRESGADGRGRALLTTDKLPDGEQLVVMPLDNAVDVRVDGDALAIWLGGGSLGDVPRQHHMLPSATPVAPWASLIGGALLLLVVAFAIIGSAVAFAWILELFT